MYSNFNLVIVMLRKKKLRIVVLMPSSHILAHNTIKSLIRKQRGIELVAVGRSNFGIFSKTAVKKLRKHQKKVGLYYSILFLLSISFYKIKIWKSRIFGKNDLSLKQLCALNNVAIRDFGNVHDVLNLQWIKKKEPDLIVSIGFDQIIKKSVLEIPKIGCINVHPGLLPYYRGVMPAFWALKTGVKRFGVSIHWMDEGIDTGDIIVKRSFKIRKNDTVQSLIEKASLISGKLLIRSLHKVRRAEFNKIIIGSFVRNARGIAGKVQRFAAMDQKIGKRIQRVKGGLGKYYAFPDRGDLKVFFARGRKLISLKRILRKLY